MKRRVLSVVVALMMVFTILPMASYAASFPDTEGHWAEKPIDRWTAAGVLNGMGDGTYMPNKYMSRAEASTVFTKLLKLTEKADVSKFTDVPAGRWYEEYVAHAVAYQIMNGTSATTFDPHGNITREQFFTTFARAVGLPSESTCNKTNFIDLNQISSWARGSVYALINHDYVHGRSATEIQPKANITRAEVAQILDNLITTYITENGSYPPAARGFTLIVAPKVSLTGNAVDRVVVSAKDAEIDLKDLMVKPELFLVQPGNTLSNALPGTHVTTGPLASDNTVNGVDVPASADYSVPDGQPTPTPTPTPTPKPGGGGGGGGGGTPATYPVNEAQADNGEISARPDPAVPGSTVTLTLTPANGYMPKSVTVRDRNGNLIPVVENADGTYSFRMPASAVTVSAEFKEIQYIVTVDLAAANFGQNQGSLDLQLTAIYDSYGATLDDILQDLVAGDNKTSIINAFDWALADVRGESWSGGGVTVTIDDSDIITVTGGDRTIQQILRDEMGDFTNRMATIKEECNVTADKEWTDFVNAIAPNKLFTTVNDVNGSLRFLTPEGYYKAIEKAVEKFTALHAALGEDYDFEALIDALFNINDDENGYDNSVLRAQSDILGHLAYTANQFEFISFDDTVTDAASIFAILENRLSISVDGTSANGIASAAISNASIKGDFSLTMTVEDLLGD